MKYAFFPTCYVFGSFKIYLDLLKLQTRVWFNVTIHKLICLDLFKITNTYVV